MKSNILFTIITVVMLASNVLAQDCPSISISSEPFETGFDVSTINHNMATGTTAQITTIDDVVLAPGYFEKLSKEDDCTLSEVQLTNTLQLESQTVCDIDCPYGTYTFEWVENNGNTNVALGADYATDYVIIEHRNHLIPPPPVSAKVKPSDDSDFDAGGVGYDKINNVLWVAGTTTALGANTQILFFAFNLDTMTITSQGGIYDSESDLSVTGADYINGKFVIRGYKGTNAMVATIDSGVFDEAYQVVNALAEPGHRQFATDQTTENRMITADIDATTGALSIGIFNIGESMSATAYDVTPVGPDVIWTGINDVKMTGTDDDKIIIGGTGTDLGIQYGFFTLLDVSGVLIVDYSKRTSTSDVSQITAVKGYGANVYIAGKKGSDAVLAEINSGGTKVQSGGYMYGYITCLESIPIEGVDYIITAGSDETHSLLGLVNTQNFQPIWTVQDIEMEGVAVTEDNSNGYFATVTKGSFGIQIYGITANPGVPEFSLTTLLLATLLAGGLVLFVVRRRK